MAGLQVSCWPSVWRQGCSCLNNCCPSEVKGRAKEYRLTAIPQGYQFSSICSVPQTTVVLVKVFKALYQSWTLDAGASQNWQQLPCIDKVCNVCRRVGDVLGDLLNRECAQRCHDHFMSAWMTMICFLWIFREEISWHNVLPQNANNVWKSRRTKICKVYHCVVCVPLSNTVHDSLSITNTFTCLSY